MRDFLTVFNTVSEACFNHCVNTFADRTTTNDEISCMERCVTKYLGLNRKVMEVFVELQPEIIKRKMDEINKMANTQSLESQDQPMAEIQAQ